MMVKNRGIYNLEGVLSERIKKTDFVLRSVYVTLNFKAPELQTKSKLMVCYGRGRTVGGNHYSGITQRTDRSGRG